MALKLRNELSVCFSLRFFRTVREARARKLLHVGRRSTHAQRDVADPGSKGWRVAWKTSFGFRPNVTEKRAARACGLGLATASISSRGRWTETRDVPDRAPRSRRSGIVLKAGRHALNVEIEVRVLVPELDGRVAQEAERFSDKEEVAGSTPASPICPSPASLSARVCGLRPRFAAGLGEPRPPCRSRRRLGRHSRLVRLTRSGGSRASSSDGMSACLTNKRPLVRLQPRPSSLARFAFRSGVRSSAALRSGPGRAAPAMSVAAADFNVAVAQPVERPPETRGVRRFDPCRPHYLAP